MATKVVLMRNSSGSTELLNGDLSGAASTRTLTLTLPEYATKLRLFVNYDFDAATSTTVTVSGSPDGTNYFDFVSRSISSGASTASSLVETIASGADCDKMLEYDVQGLKSFKAVFAGGGTPTTDDDIVVYAQVVHE